MSSSSWNDLYSQGQHMSVWPWSHLVSLVMRFSELKREPNYKVLEVGCGAGANIPFFLNYTNNFFASDFSTVIVEQLKQRFPHIQENIFVTDFTQSLNHLDNLDLVVDRGASVNNTLSGINQYLELVHNALNDDGLLIITDWMSTKSSLFNGGVAIEDGLTKTDYQDGPFVGVGPIRFFDKNAILQATQSFELVYLENVTTEVDNEEIINSAWNLVLKKKNND